MTDRDLLAALLPQQIVALTLYGEARGEGLAGMQAVASVIENRVQAQRRAWGLTHRAVCLAPFQFSCWNKGGRDPNYELLIDAARHMSRGDRVGPVLARALDVAGQVIAGELPDQVEGSTHYMTVALYKSEGCPTWAFQNDDRQQPRRKPTVRIKNHVFFANIK